MILINGKTIHLQGKNISYILYRNQEEDFLQFHFGQKLPDVDYSTEPTLLSEPSPRISGLVPVPNLNALPQEYPTFGRTDGRHPALALDNVLSNPIACLKFQNYRVLENYMPKIEAMPCMQPASDRADTLEITLVDSQIALEVRLLYTVFEEYDVIVRSAIICNKANLPITLHSAYSASLDLPIGQYDLIHFPGGWGRERMMERSQMHKGICTDIADLTGRGSRLCNPFVMISSPEADETHGQVYGFNLIYSGNHSTCVQMDCNGHLRVQQGISPDTFRWELQPGESFYTPQSVLCYSCNGFEAISHQYHRLYREHLIPKKWVDKHRPILLNSWEGCYFDFTEERILTLAAKAKEAGIELFVLDDGWFGKRDNARSSLGDWFVYEEKLPSGIAAIAQKINDLGMQFGLWFEPEMISPDSDLFRAHPDWAIRIPQYEPVQSRYQLVLDLTRQEIRDYVVETISAILRSANISYVKWDMNRNLMDLPEKGYQHRYVLGYYDIAQRLTDAFPDILFEGCCSGGGRFDPAVLSCMPQIWTSDDSDAINRLKIQYSTSMCYPLSSMGAHVSAVPNHQTGRVTPLKTRADVAYTGVFGFELDVTAMPEQDMETIAQQAAYAKHIQPLIRNGNFFRLRSPYETNECIWQVVSPDQSHSFVMACRVLSLINRNTHHEPKIRLRGLDPNANYRDTVTGICYSGSLLMYRGLTIPYAPEDFATVTIELEKI